MNANNASQDAKVTQADQKAAVTTQKMTQATTEATTEEVTASSVQVADLSVENLNYAEQAKQKLDNVLAVSHELDKYIK